jgi:pimeloyl-ACP methyl ester carboxylesterase
VSDTATTRPHVLEEATFLDAPNGPIFAVRSWTDRPGSSTTGVVLLPGGWYGTSTNGNRVFVRLSRELAALGFPAIRIDWRGMGESGGQIERFHLDLPFADEVRAAAHHLLATGCDDVVLVGFCFGAHSALNAAADLPVRALGLVSLSLPAEGAMESKTYEAASKMSITRLLAMNLRPAVLNGWLEPTTRSVYLKGARAKWRMMRRRWRSSTPAEALALERASRQQQLDRMSGELVGAFEQGASLLFVFGEDDLQVPGFEKLRHGDLAPWFADAGDRIQVVIAPGDLHGFASLESQDRTITAIRTWMAGLVPGEPS